MDKSDPFDAIREFEFEGASYKMADLTVLVQAVEDAGYTAHA